MAPSLFLLCELKTWLRITENTMQHSANTKLIGRFSDCCCWKKVPHHASINWQFVVETIKTCCKSHGRRELEMWPFSEHDLHSEYRRQCLLLSLWAVALFGCTSLFCLLLKPLSDSAPAYTSTHSPDRQPFQAKTSKTSAPDSEFMLIIFLFYQTIFWRGFQSICLKSETGAVPCYESTQTGLSHSSEAKNKLK